MMSKALTPSQLKAEFAAEKDLLLKACLSALNQIPNQRISGPFPSTYALAAQISKLLPSRR
ncbi:cobalamin biosynthesis protein CbiX [Klebsiella pneumoniae]|uniref:cobalamin biosynthesis protein CbiX n=1 Tax=Klebsiella pneumoniae TaxID=573 RepID=UPI001E324288|nr:cobalamin biosynthesis protein CbiX [Klebsiella pneumoniae]